MAAQQFPLWLKLVSSAFVAVLVPVYWVHYGPVNFLWFSDIALFGMVVALWREQRLVASMMLLAVLLPEVAWNLDFFAGLAVGHSPIGLADYMFELDRPLYLRAISLFHVPMPIILAWMVHRMGYDRRALVRQTLLAWLVLPLSFWLSDPSKNVNWVYGFGDEPQTWVAPWIWLAGLMVGFALLIYLPTHALAIRLLKQWRRPVVGRWL